MLLQHGKNQGNSYPLTQCCTGTGYMTQGLHRGHQPETQSLGLKVTALAQMETRLVLTFKVVHLRICSSRTGTARSRIVAARMNSCPRKFAGNAGAACSPTVIARIFSKTGFTNFDASLELNPHAAMHAGIPELTVTWTIDVVKCQHS
jgi:hypothetical protein